MCLAIPGQITEILKEDLVDRRGRVSFGGTVKEVNLAFTPKAGVGDYVLVHVGFALSVVDPEEARKTLDILKEMEGMDPDGEGVS